MDIKIQIELAKLELQEKQDKYHKAETDEDRRLAANEWKVAELKLKSLLNKERK